jgi:hypothetical protein
VRELEFEPDDEQEQHHAEFRYPGGGLRVSDQTKAEWADRDARGEVAEHRAQAETPEQGHRNHRRGAESQHRGQEAGVGSGTGHFRIVELSALYSQRQRIPASPAVRASRE